jgi:hypothetical protein
LAAAISAFIPPPAVADGAVDQSVELLELPPAAEDEPPAAAAVALEEPELPQPAASNIDPTAAAAATIAFDARKVKPSHARPQGLSGDRRWHLG